MERLRELEPESTHPRVRHLAWMKIPEGSEFVPFSMIFRVKDAHTLMEHLKKNGVETRTFFYPLHRQPCYQRYLEQLQRQPFLSDARYPNAIRAYEEGVCLPTFPALQKAQVDYFCGLIRDFYA